MRYLLVTVGTRGDAEPFIALALELKRLGHEVRLASTEEHEPLTRSFNVEFFSLRGNLKVFFTVAGSPGSDGW